MPRFRKRPVIIEAYQYDGKGSRVLNQWFDSHGFENYYYTLDGCLNIGTLEGVMKASPGDWIVRGVQGEFYPVKESIFNETYEEVEGPDG
jgi:hypothetical protein